MSEPVRLTVTITPGPAMSVTVSPSLEPIRTNRCEHGHKGAVGCYECRTRADDLLFGLRLAPVRP